MNKKITLLCTLALALPCAAFLTTIERSPMTTPSIDFYHVDFFDNYLRENFTLSSGYSGKGNNLLYTTQEVAYDNLVTKPEDPTRPNYDFIGWYKEEKCINEWNFETDKVQGNTRLFAKWSYSTEAQELEPEYTPPSTVLDESAETDYVIDSVMFFKINDGAIKVSASAIAKLENQKDNVLPLMEYRVKASKTFSATYGDGFITVTCGDDIQKIQVINDTANLIINDTNYETKAKKYEAKVLEEDIHHVMLAGSSSIEFWTSSKEDLDPIVSYNHGIGGTTIENWDTCLNQRLVFPYKPKMVVYYVGINNVINSKQSASIIWGHLKDFFDHSHEAMPNTNIQYIMMNLIPGFQDYFETIINVNNEVIKYQKANPWLTLINPGLVLLKQVDGVDGILPAGAYVNVRSNIQLTAVWEEGTVETPTSFKVSFDANGGTGEMATIDTIGEYTLPKCAFEAPTDMTFAGWKVNGNGKVLKADAKINVASDIELVAQWVGETLEQAVEAYKVRLNPNGSDGSMPTIEEVRGQYKLPGCAFTAPEGMHFAGWKVDGDPNAAFFRTDGLHLSNYGYVLWGEVIRQSIMNGLKG